MKEKRTKKKTATDLIAMLPQRYDPAFPIIDLEHYPGNPKDHDVGAITESIDRNGWYGAVLVQEWPNTPRYILAGHGRVDTLIAKGVPTVPVLFVQCDPKTARRILLVDNRAAELGGMNLPALVEFAAADALDGNLAGSGYDGDDLDTITKKLSAPLAFQDLDETLDTEHQCPRCRYE